MLTPHLKIVPGRRDELEKEAVQLIFAPKAINQARWSRIIDRLTRRRGHLKPVPDRDGL